MQQEHATRPEIEVDTAALLRAPVDALAGVVVLVAALVMGLSMLVLTVGSGAGLVAFVVWLVAKPVGFIAFATPIVIVSTYVLWQVGFFVSINSLEALGVRVHGRAIWVCMVFAPVMAPSLGVFAGLRLLGHQAAARPFLALVGAVVVVLVVLQVLALR